MIRMEYTGKIPELRGKTALVRADPGAWKGYAVKDPTQFVMAQFDEKVTFGGVKMHASWHHFMRTDFTPLGDKPIF
jgi:hypothetical protein